MIMEGTAQHRAVPDTGNRVSVAGAVVFQASL